MPKVPYLITSFATGEISRKQEGHIGTQGYQSALRTAENVFITPNAEGRPGTVYVGTTENTAEKCRLFPFERADGTSYVIEMTNSNARFYKSNARLTGGTTDIAIPTALTDAQLFDLHYSQVGDVIYFVTARNVARMFKITYTSDTSWAADVVTITPTVSITYNTSAPNAPSVIALHEQRLVIGGDNATPTRVLGSVVNNYENFSVSASPVADEFWDYKVPGGGGGLWLLAWTGLLWGGGTEEYSFGTDVITPVTLPNLKRQSKYGSSRIQPVLAQNTGIFVQSGGKRVREVVFSNDLQAYIAPDLTAISQDITGAGGLTDMALQESPTSVLWCVRSDGQMALLNSNESGTRGWSRCVTRSGDSFESVAVIRNGAEDQVWVSVKRSVNGSETRYIEYFNVRDFGTDQADAIYLDSSVTFDGGAAKTITGITKADPPVVTSATHGLATGDFVRIEDVVGMTELNTLHDGVFYITKIDANTFSLQDPIGLADISTAGFGAYVSGGTATQVKKVITGLGHLENESCGVLADGGAHPDRTPNGSGEVTLQEYHNTVHVGLRYNQDVEPAPIEPPEAAGRSANLARIRIKVSDTLGLSVGPDSSNLSPIIFRDVDDPLSTPPSLFTGIKKKNIKGKYACPASIFVRQSDPLPMTILGISCDVEINDVV